jgi:LPS-assembly protein
MRNVGRCVSFAFSLILVVGTAAFADDNRAEAATIDAEQMRFDRETNMAYGDGNVVIRYKGATLQADHVKFNNQTKDCWADGNVRVNRDGQEWVAPSVFYNFDTKDLRTDRARGFTDPVYVRADDVHQVESNHYAFGRATGTTCDDPHPHYRIETRHGEIYPGDRVVLYGATLKLGEVPVLWSPIVIYSLKGDQPPLAISLGASSRWGFFILSTTYWRINDNAQLAIHLDERTDRGIGSGADLKYRLGVAGQGTVRGYYASDTNPDKTDDASGGKDLPSNRWRVNWQHKAELPDDVSVTINANKQSDRAIINDFFSHEFRHETEPESVADVTKRGDSYTLSLLARPQFNDFFAEVERLPEAKLAINRTRIFDTPLFYEGETSAGYYNNVAGDTSDSLFRGNTARADTFHELLVPDTLFGWLSVIPRAGIRGTYYLRAPDAAPDTNEVHRVVYDLGMETSFKLWRTWDNVRSDFLAIDGLRHILQPFADYQWVPTPNVSSNELFQFDTLRTTTNRVGESFSVTRWEPLEFPAYDLIDAIDKQNVLRFGLRQKLQTRRDGRPWDLVELEGWTDWRIEHNPSQRDFNDLFGTLRLRPASWIAIDAFSRYDMNAGSLEEFNTSAHVFDMDRWSFGVGTRYLKDDSNLVSADVACRLGRQWLARTFQRVSLQDGVWEEQEYVLRQETHDWFINYGFRYRSQRARSDEKAVFFSVTLKAYPGVSLSMNRIDLASGD